MIQNNVLDYHNASVGQDKRIFVYAVRDSEPGIGKLSLLLYCNILFHERRNVRIRHLQKISASFRHEVGKEKQAQYEGGAEKEDRHQA